VLANADAWHRIYCVFSGPPELFPQQIRETCAKSGAELVLLDAPVERFANWRIDQYTHFSPANYFRLALPELVAEDRLIYLDCDLIVTCGLSELYRTELGEAWIAGRLDPLARAMSQMPLPEDEPYVNSGVMVMDCASLRRHRPLDVVRDYYERYESGVTLVDQCLINKLVEGKKHLLDARWNVQFDREPPAGHERLIREFEGRGVLHFNGPLKPWMQWAPSRSIALWRRYADLAGIDVAGAFVKATDTLTMGRLAARQEAEEDWRGAAASWRAIAVVLDKQLQKARRRS
jgi:lipopolysaccharide biosynthesis glycosyltransferase